MFGKVLNLFSSSEEGNDNEKAPVDSSEGEVKKTQEELRLMRLNRFSESPEVTTKPENKEVPTPIAIEIIPNIKEVPSSPIVPEKAPTVADPPKKEETAKASPTKQSKTSKKEEEPESKQLKWQNVALTRLLGCTVQPEDSSKVYLKFLADDLYLSEKPVQLSFEVLERAIVERLSNGTPKPFLYLIEVLKTLKTEMRRYRNEEKKKQLKSVEDLVTQYSFLLLTHPNYFGTSDSVKDEFITSLVDSSLPSEFLTQLMEHLGTEECKPFFSSIFSDLTLKKIAPLSLIDDKLSIYIDTVLRLLQYKELAELFVRDKNWLVSAPTTGKDIQDLTHLGSLLSFGCIPTKKQSDVAITYFQDIDVKAAADLRAITNTLRVSIHRLTLSLSKAMMTIIRTLKDEGKEACLAWFAQLLNYNREYGKLQVNQSIVVDLALLFNVGSILLSFCDPFLVKGASAFARIDISYLQSGIRINVEGETKISVNSEQLESWVDKRNQSNIETWNQENPGIAYDASKMKKIEKAGFTTECFFLTLRALHFGYMKGHYTVSKIYEHVQKLKSSGRNDTQAQIASAESLLKCYEVHLLDIETQKKLAQFYVFVGEWLLHIIDPQSAGLPLGAPTMEYATLPEFIVDDIAEFFSLSARVFTHFLSWYPYDKIISLVVLLIGSPSYVKNPYLRAKLLSILVQIVRVANRDPSYRDKVQLLFATNNVLKRYATSVLFKFYVDIERTGSHTQFFSKFSVRADIQLLFEFMWTLPAVRLAMIQVANTEEQFIQFISMVLNDGIYLLDEGLQTLYKIKDYQMERKDSVAWDALTSTVREDKESDFRSHERRAASLLRSADATLNMLLYLSSEVVEPFMRPELVSRIANMLNYFMEQLVGPKCTKLAVENREKYAFEPKKLLALLVEIYLNLDQFVFVAAVGKDPRCYAHSAFLRTRDIIRKTGIRPETVAENFEEFANRVKEMVEEAIDIEYPDEFLDPVMAEVMTDPVKLPSGVTMDRSVILTHLLNVNRDPFTNLPLTIEDLVPDEEMKEKIENFIREQTQKKFEQK